MIKKEQLLKTAAELNDIMGLNPPISPVLDTASVIETIQKIIRLGLINPTDIFTPETEALIEEIKKTPEDGLFMVEPAEEQPEEKGDLYNKVATAMKLRELKNIVMANVEFKDVRPDLDSYKNVEILRDALVEIITKQSMEEDSGVAAGAEVTGSLTEQQSDPEPELEPEPEPQAPVAEGTGLPNLFVHPRFKGACPLLSEAEYASLEDLISRDGKIYQPILTWNNFIVDGHNRYDIAVKYNIPFAVEEKEFADEDEVVLWIKENALSQRNLSDYAKYEMIKSIEADLKSIGIKHMRYKSMLDEINTHNTRELLAEKSGLSTSQIARAKVIEEQAPESVKEDLRAGKIKIGTAHKDIKKKEKAAYNDADDALKAAKELKKWVKKHTKNELLKDLLQEVKPFVDKINNLVTS
jgi:hypothetical protein